MTPKNNELVETLREITLKIWERRPILGEIIEKHGSDTLFDYAQDFADVNPSPRLDARKPELISTVERLLTPRLGPSIAKRAGKQLTKLPLVSTSDHHAIVDHPFWVNANIITALPFHDSTDVEIDCLVVFSFASVSMNNESGFPRGIDVHGGVSGSGNYIRLPFFSDKYKMSTIYGMHAIRGEDIVKSKHELAKRHSRGELTDERRNDIDRFIEQVINRPEILQEPDFCSQATTINFDLWPSFFDASPRETEANPHRSRRARRKDRKCGELPQLIYLEIEMLVRELLLTHHLFNTQSIIHRALFDASVRSSIEKSFDGIPGGFSLSEGWGSYLFWGLDAKGHRLKMVRQDDDLVSPTKGVSVNWTPEGVAQGLRDFTIFPGMLLCYLVVSLYYGMKCLGGFCQVHDLTLLKERWMSWLEEQNMLDEREAVRPVQTRELGGDGMVLAYLSTPQGTLVPATGIDLALEEHPLRYDQYVELSKHLTISEIMQPMLPEMYTVLYTGEERNNEWRNITTEQIMKETGLEEKIRRLYATVG